MTEMKLFAIYIGGSVEASHLELHDMRFAFGETIEDCYPALKAQWWGTPASLHLDAWGVLGWADGYKIQPAPEPVDDAMKLWFIHLGGYDPAQFTELHHNVFLVAPDWRSAKQRAMEDVTEWFSPHKDASLGVENIIDVAAAAGSELNIRLTPEEESEPFQFEARYVPLGNIK